MLLRQVELALLLKMRASVVLTQGLELGLLLGELVRETALRRNGAGPSGMLVLRAYVHTHALTYTHTHTQSANVYIHKLSKCVCKSVHINTLANIHNNVKTPTCVCLCVSVMRVCM